MATPPCPVFPPMGVPCQVEGTHAEHQWHTEDGVLLGWTDQAVAMWEANHPDMPAEPFGVALPARRADGPAVPGLRGRDAPDRRSLTP